MEDKIELRNALWVYFAWERKQSWKVDFVNKIFDRYQPKPMESIIEAIFNKYYYSDNSDICLFPHWWDSYDFSKENCKKMMKELVGHLTKEEPVCKACLWKGKHSVYTQEIWAEDFWWDWYVKQPEIKMVNCKRCDGKGKEEPVIEFKLPWNCPYCQTRLELPSPVPKLKIEKIMIRALNKDAFDDICF